MTRRRFIQIDGELVEVPVNAPVRKPVAPAILGDLPEYESPIDDSIIAGRKQRREDLRRSGCRPYEGWDVEKREADKVRAEMDRKAEKRWEERVEQTYYEIRDGMTPKIEVDNG